MSLVHNPVQSPWPFFLGVSRFFFMFSFGWYFYSKGRFFLRVSLLLLIWFCYNWWQDISMESFFSGFHTYEVQKCIKFRMVLFIFSECIFFFSFFWSFFHFSLCPSVIVGLVWPPTGLTVLDPFSVPLLNTYILLRSGVTLTVSHYLIIGKKSLRSWYLFLTIFLGYLFTRFQYFEYQRTRFTFSDSVFGSLFFIITGFHGLHVMVGTVFLFACWIRLGMGAEFVSQSIREYSASHHVSFELAIWYWHFVDVVWLFLYIIVYVWGI